MYTIINKEILVVKLKKDRVNDLFSEIKMAEAYNEQEIEPICGEAIMRYTGRHIPDIGQRWDIVVNEIYPIVQYNLPAIYFRNPRVFLKPKNKFYIVKQRDPITGKMVDVKKDSSKSAKIKEAVTNYQLNQIGYKKEVQKVLMDALMFPHGILWHGYKGDFGMTEENSMYIKSEQIFAKRISPLKFIKDPNVSFSNLDEARWVGRIIDIPYIDFIEDTTLNIKKDVIKGFIGYGDKVGSKDAENYLSQGGDIIRANQKYRSLIDFTAPSFKESLACRFVRVYEIYLRPTKKEQREGSRGKILLLCNEQDEPLRENEWSVKAQGFPAQILEFNPVPDQTLAMPDIDSYKAIADQKNAIRNLQLRNAKENSKVYVGIAKEGVDGEEDIEKIQNGDQTILLFPTDNVQGRLTVQSAGGSASNELYLIDQRQQRDLEDKSGVSDLKKGFLQSGEESATSVKIRSAGGSARSSYRQDIMADFLKNSIKYIIDLEEQYTTITDVVRITGSLDIEWSEKPTEEDVKADVDVEIDVISMMPENPEKEIAELREVLGLMVEAIANPSVMQKIQQEGKTVNITPVIEQLLMRLKIKDPNILRNIQPEEQLGFVSIQQLMEGKQNIESIIQTGQPTIPPKETDDHRVKLELYGTINGIVNAMGQRLEGLEQLIAMQQAMLQEAMRKQEDAPLQSPNMKASNA